MIEYPAQFVQAVEAVSDALDKLAAVGSTRQIADFLEAEGLTGSVLRNRFCVVHSYLADKADASITVGLHGVGIAAYGRKVRIAAPLSIADFIEAFDRGEFPKLISP